MESLLDLLREHLLFIDKLLALQATRPASKTLQKPPISYLGLTLHPLLHLSSRRFYVPVRRYPKIHLRAVTCPHLILANVLCAVSFSMYPKAIALIEGDERRQYLQTFN